MEDFIFEDNIENKILYYAHHFGQKVKRSFLPEQNYYLSEIDHNTFRIAHLVLNSFLELKSLELLKDEDLKGIYPHGVEQFFMYYGNGNKKLAVDRFLNRFQIQPEWLDLLRMRGFAVPFMGLSIEQLVERSWLKVITEEIEIAA